MHLRTVSTKTNKFVLWIGRQIVGLQTFVPLLWKFNFCDMFLQQWIVVRQKLEQPKEIAIVDIADPLRSSTKSETSLPEKQWHLRFLWEASSICLPLKECFYQEGHWFLRLLLLQHFTHGSGGQKNCQTVSSIYFPFPIRLFTIYTASRITHSSYDWKRAIFWEWVRHSAFCH